MKNILTKIFNKKNLKVVWVLYALFSIITILLFADMQLRKDLNPETDRYELNGSWNVSIDEEQYENVYLDTFRFYPVSKGTQITMETSLPNTWDFESAALTLHVRQTTVDIFVDDEQIYTYGHERNEDRKTVGSGIQFINLSDDAKGKNLKIILNVTENLAFSSFDPIYLSEWNDSFRLVATENRLPLFLGSFLLVFGVAVSLITTFVVIYSKKYLNVLWLSVFSIFMGFWTLCYHNLVVIFSIPLYATSLLEYMSLLLAPLPIIGYMYTYVKQLNNKKILWSYKILFTVQIFLSVLTIVLHTTDIAHSAAMLPYSQFLFVVHSIFFTYILLKNNRKNELRTVLYAVGFAVILFSIVYDLLVYILNRYSGLHIYDLKAASSLGIITFIIILIIDLAYDITSKMMEEKEKEMLIRRAYTDELTQINNRTYCSEYMNKLQAEINQKYTIFNFDLNDLKITNDTKGHTQGDLLIKSAANVISDTFSPYGVVGRMGGDEFVAIVPINDRSQLDKLCNTFAQNITKANEADTSLNLSISYGFASNDELTENNIEKVYNLADNRMYTYKKAYKGNK